MKKNIITIAIAAGIVGLAASSAVRAASQKPAAYTHSQSVQCDDCHDGDAPPSPTPAPSPAK